MYHHRDVLFLEENKGTYQVLVCDSSASIGLKEYDVVSVDPSIVGAMAMRVCLLELLTIGAAPQGMSLTFGCEWDPTGKKIFDGCLKELEKYGNTQLPYIMSTEKNFPTKQTSLGLTLTGSVGIANVFISPIEPGDYVYLLGQPYVGEEVLEHSQELVSYQECREILKEGIGKEMIPIGSKGIEGELEALLSTHNLQCEYNEGIDIDRNKSGGPSTCLIYISSDQSFNKGHLIGIIKDK